MLWYNVICCYLPKFILWQMLLPIDCVIQHILWQVLYQYMVAMLNHILWQMLLPIFSKVVDVIATYCYT